MLERWGNIQRNKGNIPGAEMARTLREQYGNVVLESTEESPLQTPEIQVEAKRFTDEQKEALVKEGYVIYELTGQSIKSQKEQGRKFWSTWHKDYSQFEALTSMHSEVAINPDQLFIPKSNNKTLRL